MKRIVVASMLLISTLLALTGCGGEVVVTVPPVVTQVISTPALDGDIEVGSTFTAVSQGTAQSYFVGIDPVTLSETRAFLDFSLATVPINAIISSATLDFRVESLIPFNASVPVLVDLVSYPQPLVAADFDRLFFTSTTILPPINAADVGRHVTVDVTTLMQEAQRQGFSHFQIRLLKGSGGTSTGLVEINDSTGVNRGAVAPLLTVAYF